MFLILFVFVLVCVCVCFRNLAVVDSFITAILWATGKKGSRLKTWRRELNDTQFIVSTCAQLLEEIKCTSGVKIVLWCSFHHSSQKVDSCLQFWENFHLLILIFILLLLRKHNKTPSQSARGKAKDFTAQSTPIGKLSRSCVTEAFVLESSI